MRWKITVEYHGGGFVGWQRQINGLSVQQAIEGAITRFSGETPRVTGAGRTDAGVHAKGQVAHFDLEKSALADTIRDALNAHLRPALVSVLEAEAMPDGFDARFMAKRRHYLYRILNRRPPEALESGLAWHVAKPLDARLMHDTAQCLIGRHDYSTFRAAACQARSPVRTIESLAIERLGDHVELRVAAPSFLHHQVRNIIGTLKLVGEGKWSRDQFETAFAAHDRTLGGPTAPPQGLYFMAVEY